MFTAVGIPYMSEIVESITTHLHEYVTGGRGFS